MLLPATLVLAGVTLLALGSGVAAGLPGDAAESTTIPTTQAVSSLPSYGPFPNSASSMT